MTEATDHSRRILCIVNAGFLLLVLGGAAPGSSVADTMTATSVNTCLNSSSFAPSPLCLTFFSAGLFPLFYLFL